MATTATLSAKLRRCLDQREENFLPQLRKIEAAHRARTKGGHFGSMTPGLPDTTVVRRHLLALEELGSTCDTTPDAPRRRS